MFNAHAVTPCETDCLVDMDALISRAVTDLKTARNAVALTGAGISIESGIPPFRGKGGLWEKFDPMEIAHIDALIRDPARVWKVLVKDLKDIMDRAAPNDGHKGLARLEQMGILKTVITQNIDGLHQVAGNTDVIEFHGTFAWQRCMKCDGASRPARSTPRCSRRVAAAAAFCGPMRFSSAR